MPAARPETSPAPAGHFAPSTDELEPEWFEQEVLATGGNVPPGLSNTGGEEGPPRTASDEDAGVREARDDTDAEMPAWVAKLSPVERQLTGQTPLLASD